jgi:hypothetical protein
VREEFSNFVDGVSWDTVQYIFEPGVWFDAVQFTCAQQAVEHAAFGSGFV